MFAVAQNHRYIIKFIGIDLDSEWIKIYVHIINSNLLAYFLMSACDEEPEVVWSNKKIVKRDYYKMVGVIWDTVRSVNVLETS